MDEIFGRSFSRSLMVVAATGLLLAGCASTPEPTTPEEQQAATEANDPWEGTNRSVFKFNRALDDGVGKPVARAYRDVVPQFGRDGIRNFVQNFGEPINFINAVLQGEDGRAAETAVRFIFNTTAGFGGFFDVAADYGLKVNDEDFGQTLAVWGVEEGPYVMLPILGPSSVRGVVGKIVDNFSNPIGYFFPAAGSITKSIAGGVDKRERNLEALDDIERNSLDYYAALRSLYRQNRQDLVNNGEPQGPVLDIPVYAD